MMEKTLQYSSKRTKKSFYFQSKVSARRAVLHGQAPYQHCDSSMQYNLQDQRFQKILMPAYRHHLKSSLPFRQRKLKFSECILKLWIPHAFQWQPKPLPASLCLLHEPLCYALRMSVNQARELIYLKEWVSFSWINCAGLFLPCWHITGVAQGREKQAMESRICLHWLKYLYNI